MTDIDFSKAPEWATHYAWHEGDSGVTWYEVFEGGFNYSYKDENRKLHSNESPLGWDSGEVKPIPKEFDFLRGGEHVLVVKIGDELKTYLYLSKEICLRYSGRRLQEQDQRIIAARFRGEGWTSFDNLETDIVKVYRLNVKSGLGGLVFPEPDEPHYNLLVWSKKVKDERKTIEYNTLMRQIKELQKQAEKLKP